MSQRGAKPLFVDTGAFYARFDESASRHERANAVFEGIGQSEYPYRPLYTSTYVLDELATLILSHRNHSAAVEAVERIRESSVTIIHPDRTEFESAYEKFVRYDDHEVSFTDQMSGVLAEDRGVEHVFSFDTDHFRTLGFTVVPDDTGEA
jgi:predicted nucleic acid-binding protein